MSASLIQRASDELGAQLVPFTVDQYHRIFETGIRRRGEPIELIDGLLVYKDRHGIGDSTNGQKTFLERAEEKLGALFVPISVDEMHRMMDEGILREGDPIELVDGMLVTKDRGNRGDSHMHGVRHRRSVSRLDKVLRQVESRGWSRQIQLPITLAAKQEPEPEASIVRGTEDDFADRHPGPADLAAVFEASDSTLKYDRTTKLAIYASAAIPLYLIINLVDDQVELYRKPDPEQKRFSESATYRPGDTIELELEAGYALPLVVSDIIPPRKS